jgi:hypothetical protein
VAGAAAVLAQGRPELDARALKALLVGATSPVGDGRQVGRLDLEGAVLREVAAEPSTVSFGAIGRGRPTLEQTLTVRNVSTRDLTVRVDAGKAQAGVVVTASRPQLALRAGESTEVRLEANTADLPQDARAVLGAVQLRVDGSYPVRVPWSLASPDPGFDLLSHATLKTTGGRISDATPAVLSLVVGGVGQGAMPEVRPVDELELQLFRNGKLLGVLAKRRELLPGRYTFGLTGRGSGGGRLRRGEYTLRVVARPSDGTRRQVENVSYAIR